MEFESEVSKQQVILFERGNKPCIYSILYHMCSIDYVFDGFNSEIRSSAQDREMEVFVASALHY